MGSGKTHWGPQLSAKVGVPFFDLDTVIIEKETGSRWAAQKPVATPSVIGHDVPSGSMERNQTGLAKLCLANGEDALAEIHVRLLQLEHLADTQTCHCQQPEQAVVCPRPEALAGR